jgi:hypothetical protein
MMQVEKMNLGLRKACWRDLRERGQHLQGGRMAFGWGAPGRFTLWVCMESFPKERHAKVRINRGTGKFMPSKSKDEAQKKEENEVIY